MEDVTNASSVEFVQTFEAALKDKGVWDKLTSQVRCEILQILKSPIREKEIKSEYYPGSVNFLINELIKEYLDFNGFQHSADVLSVESGQPMKRSNRNDLEKVLKVHTGPNAKQVPLLYSIVSSLRRN